MHQVHEILSLSLYSLGLSSKFLFLFLNFYRRLELRLELTILMNLWYYFKLIRLYTEALASIMLNIKFLAFSIPNTKKKITFMRCARLDANKFEICYSDVLTIELYRQMYYLCFWYFLF